MKVLLNSAIFVLFSIYFCSCPVICYDEEDLPTKELDSFSVIFESTEKRIQSIYTIELKGKLDSSFSDADLFISFYKFDNGDYKKNQCCI